MDQEKLITLDQEEPYTLYNNNNNTLRQEQQHQQESINGCSSDTKTAHSPILKKPSCVLDKADAVECQEYVLKNASSEKKNILQRITSSRYFRVLLHLAMWLIFTGFLCAAYAINIPKGYNQELLVLGIIYLWFSLYLFFCYVSTNVVADPWNCCIDSAADYLCRNFSLKTRTVSWCLFVITVIATTIFSFPESDTSPRTRRLISFLGLFVFVFGTFAFSVHRRHVKWNTISTAILLQFLLALFVFKSSVGQNLFRWLSEFVEGYLHNAWYGIDFVLGDAAANSGVFAINVFPAIIFFASTVQILYYYGIIQWILRKASVIFIKILGISGPESIVAIASPFLGLSENALLIEPLIKHLTKSEIHQILTCGFATIAGSVLYGYIAMGVSGQALLTSCIMSIPCSIAISKLRYPETEESVVDNIDSGLTDHGPKAANALHAASKGAEVGINIVLLMIANLISILALLYAVNAFLTWLGDFITIQNLTLQLITGYLFVPVAWLIGVDNKDLISVGRLLAIKIWANEFVAYQELTTTYKGHLSARSELVTTYALCGFANLGSVGMQVGILSSLAPTRAGEISKLAVSALICGSISTYLSASIAGMLG